MQTAEIHSRFLKHFEAKDHTIVPSASLVSDDPAIMFTIAGMVPFIPYLSGRVPAPWPRVADVQKCIRTLDIEEVGRTPRHGTFFQMAGNWSFGDYFKREAIAYAWELLTGSEADGKFGFDPKDLWVTVFETDDEAERLWLEVTDVDASRIQRLGLEDNYWMTGQPGPAGPDSEIFFDLGPEHGPDGGPATGSDRYVEIWNLVFMQDEIADVRSKTDFTIVRELPNKNIDTGMGLERVAFLKQGVQNIYEIDQVRPVLDVAGELSGRRYGAATEDDVRMRVVADHVRSSLMLMGDGVTPGNDGRGYILRRLMRRSVRSMRLLGVHEATFPALFEASYRAMVTAYPELEAAYPRIARLAVNEEETFLRTLESGSTVLDLAMSDVRRDSGHVVPGKTAFLLHDTYGFPIDLTMEIAEEAGLEVDRSTFETLMSEQRTRAKADAKSRRRQLADLSVYSELRAKGETAFLGYDELQADGEVIGIIADGAQVQRAGVGDEVEVVLTATSLYAESGGQDSDQGTLVGSGFEADVLDVQRPVQGLISHTVRVTSGELAVGDLAHAAVDPLYRRAANQAHSATHVVHAALRQLLGPDAAQSGSYNKAGYMRLDFSWSSALSSDMRQELEGIANSAIRDDLPVETRVMPIDEAKSLGAMALFGEKYGDTVRMVDIGGPWSRELCGGTHVGASSQIGLISITSESSVGSTNRRVEAAVGPDAFRQLVAERTLVSELTGMLKTPKEQLPGRIQELVTSLKAAEKRIAEFESQQLAGRVGPIAEAAEAVGALRFASVDLGRIGSADDLRSVASQVRERLGADPAVVAIGGGVDGRPAIVVATNQAARDAGVVAGPLAKAAAGALGGGGGGKPDMAQGGGQDAAAMPAAIAAVREGLRR
ncbi:alanine--tRNA ligase [Agrococcus sp. SCSIO52902]|uniref:alanine--tRNA ligase n=1 Tax=Agrococcus sp. SCSIO52902 TaxID=2933290 RepID=UPI001FF3A39E|nr:alanine--tRNA ligase [Agrococcus sp. SCSIO52902]UOW00533.1 alanine--tRNA ligase [Agrococcus sp. SCSIO52902]